MEKNKIIDEEWDYIEDDPDDKECQHIWIPNGVSGFGYGSNGIVTNTITHRNYKCSICNEEKREKV